MKIEFNSEWFQSGYFVYVLVIEHKDNPTFYYIGQTGDRNHHSARSPFYRLMGHFNPYNLKTGTDAQLVKGLIKHKLIEVSEGESVRVAIERAISSNEIKITAHYFKIFDFDSEDHKKRRNHTEDIETCLIQMFCKTSTTCVFNEKESRNDTARQNKKAIDMAEQIYSQLISQLERNADISKSRF